jgi:hypothetical protein
MPVDLGKKGDLFLGARSEENARSAKQSIDTFLITSLGNWLSSTLTRGNHSRLLLQCADPGVDCTRYRFAFGEFGRICLSQMSQSSNLEVDEFDSISVHCPDWKVGPW